MILFVNSTLSFYLIILQREFLIIKNSGVREELIYLPFFLLTQLQQINTEEHIFGEYALVHLTFGLCTPPTAKFPFT